MEQGGRCFFRTLIGLSKALDKTAEIRSVCILHRSASRNPYQHPARIRSAQNARLVHASHDAVRSCRKTIEMKGPKISFVFVGTKCLHAAGARELGPRRCIKHEAGESYK
jgi:hypothetical protein